MKTTASPKRKIVILFSFIVFHFCSYSQEYLRAFGVRVGGYDAYYGLSYKEYLTPAFAIETVLGKNPGSGDRNTSLQVLFEFNGRLGMASKANWYVGGGPAVKYWYDGTGYVNGRTTYVSNPNKFRGMVNTVAGIELKIARLPLNVAVDMGPSFNVYPYFQLNFMVNASFRYTIKNDRFTAHHQLRKKSYRSHHRHF